MAPPFGSVQSLVAGAAPIDRAGSASAYVERATGMSWRDRWFARRDRIVASAAFQRWAVRFPVTRSIARRRARALFDLVAGFVYSQVLLACVRTGLFTKLAAGARRPPEIAAELGLTDDAAVRLMAAAASLRLLQARGDGRFGLGPLGAPLLGNPGLIALIEHHAVLYGDLRDPVALLRGEVDRTELAGYWPYAGAAAPAELGADRVAVYSALMAASQPMIADEVLRAYSIRKHRCLLDVGGGEGAFIAAAAAQAPQLRLMLFDLPAVAQRARARLTAQGLGERVQIVGGDFFADRLPTGADVISLVRVIYDHDDEHALAILKNVRTALPAGGVLLLTEPMADTPGAEPMGDAYFGFYLLAMGRGRSRSPVRLEQLLRQAGFDQVRLLRNGMPLQTRLIVAK